MKVRVNLYALVSDAVESGIESGYAAVENYDGEVTKEFTQDKLHELIMSNLTEYIDFGDFYAVGE